MHTDDFALVPREPAPVAVPPERVLTPRDVLRPLFRHRRAGFRLFVALLVLLALVTWFWPTHYTAEMKILVKRDRLDVAPSQAPQPAPEITDSDVNSEVVLLTSRDLLEQVAVDSHLVPADARRDHVVLSRAVLDLERHLTVEPVRKTAIIDVQYTSRDPRVAASVLRDLARRYLEKHLAVNRPAGAREFFDQQARRLRDELAAAQKRLVDFGKQEHTASAASEKDSTLQKLAEFQANLEQVRAQVADSTRRIAALQQEMATTPPRLTTVRRSDDNGEMIRDLTAKVLDLEIKRTEMLRKFTPAYPPVVQLEQQLSQARAALAAAQRSPIKDETTDQNPTYVWQRNELARAQAEREALEARAAATARTIEEYQARAMRLDGQSAVEQDLIRAVKSAEENYLLYQRRAEESRIADALDQRRIANVAVAEAATVPALPSTRRTLLFLAGLALAAILSAAAALLMEYFNPRFRSRTEVEAVLELPVLAAIPASLRR